MQVDGPDNMSSGSDVTVAQSGQPCIDESLEEARSPRVELEDAVSWLQKDLAEYRKEFG